MLTVTGTPGFGPMSPVSSLTRAQRRTASCAAISRSVSGSTAMNSSPP